MLECGTKIKDDIYMFLPNNHFMAFLQTQALYSEHHVL